MRQDSRQSGCSVLATLVLAGCDNSNDRVCRVGSKPS